MDIYARCCVQTGPLVTAKTVSQYLTSPFNVWADAFAPPEKKDPLDAQRNLLFRRGREHEEEIVKETYPDAERLSYTDEKDGFSQVLEFLRAGMAALHNAPLFFTPERLQGRADLLERREGRSVFGDFHYVVKEIKLAKNLDKDHIIQAAFYNHVLGKIQDYTPEKFYLIDGEGEEHEYPFAKYEAELLSAINGALRIIDGEEKPLAFYKGAEWPWESYASELAEQAESVSLIAGLGPSKCAPLCACGITTVEAFRTADPELILAIKGIGKTTYEKAVRQAESLLTRQVIKLAPPELPSVPLEIYFDIEGDPGLGIDYLYGCLEVREGNDAFKDFWADTPEEERALWDAFCAYIRELPEGGFVLYHYTSYEKTSLRRLAALHGNGQLEKIERHMCDLYPVLTKSFTLPLYQYSIKPVAKYLGFSWRASDAGGGNSMEWYAQYLEGRKEMKEKILQYNEDDVRATKVLKEWMMLQHSTPQ